MDEKTPEVVTETALAVPEKKEATLVKDDEQTFLMATNPYQMGKIQGKLVDWAKKKIEMHKTELAEHKENMELAKKNKVRWKAYERYMQKSQKEVEFYEKVLAALEAGYCIVPDMDVELFAIRTTRKAPKRNMSHGSANWGGPGVNDQESNHPPVGEGRYVDVQAFTKEREYTHKEERTGKEEQRMMRWADRFDGIIDFPFKLAKPAVLDTAIKAMALKTFDEIGVLPKSRRQPDPVVVGRISMRTGPYGRRKSLNFLIAWFLDTKDL
jgi:hypothetical protein